MKRFLLIAFLLLPVSRLAAQGTNWLVEAGITMGFMDRMSIMGLGRLYDETMYGGLYKTAEITLTNYYEAEGAKSKAVFLPALNFKALRRIPKVPWLSAGVAALWNYAYKDYFGGPAPLHESEHILHALPCCRFYYLQ